MSLSGLIDLLGTVMKHWTPEKIKSRARLKLNKLEKEKDALLKKPATPANIARCERINTNINFLRQYLAQH